MTIGQSIRKVREGKGYSRERLARMAKTTAGTIFQWEYGINTPTISLLIAVANVLGVTLDELVGRKVEK